MRRSEELVGLLLQGNRIAFKLCALVGFLWLSCLVIGFYTWPAVDALFISGMVIALVLWGWVTWDTLKVLRALRKLAGEERTRAAVAADQIEELLEGCNDNFDNEGVSKR